MSILERLIQEARTLPFEERQKLLDELSHDTSDDEQAIRLEAIRKARGSMKGILPSTGDFLAEKHAELEREEK